MWKLTFYNTDSSQFLILFYQFPKVVNDTTESEKNSKKLRLRLKLKTELPFHETWENNTQKFYADDGSWLYIFLSFSQLIFMS